MTEALLLVLALALCLACGLFVAAEFSLTTVERAELERAVDRGERGAAGALQAVRGLTFQLSGAQLGITVTNLVVGMLAEPSIATLLHAPLRAAGVPDSATSSAALVLGTALSTVVLMVVGELVPKNWAISRPLTMVKRVSAFQRTFSAVFRPFIGHLNNTANRVLRLMGLEPAEELASARSPKELAALARHSAKKGSLEADTAELFVRTLGLADLTAENVMTPRMQVVALESDATVGDVVDTSRATGLSRFPVYRGNLDTVLGYVHVKDVLGIPADSRARHPLTPLLREPVLVPETLTVDHLMDRLTDEHSMAVVIDEYGGTAGVVTMEDVVEEVIGQVRDEHDPLETPGLLPSGAAPDGRMLFDADGGVRPDQLAEIGLRVPEGPYETLAGLVATELGRIPVDGDVLDVGGWRLDVVDTTGRRAARVLLLAPPPGEAGDEGDGGGAGGTDGNGGGAAASGRGGRGEPG